MIKLRDFSATDLPVEERVHVTLQSLFSLRGVMKNSMPKGYGGGGRFGQHLSRVRGRGMVFAETRSFQPGDEMRHMDWRVTARTGKPHVKVFWEEREKPLLFLIDKRSHMAFGTRKFFKSVILARFVALWAWQAVARGDRVGGVVFREEGCQILPSRSGLRGVLPLLHALDDTKKPEQIQFHKEGNSLDWGMENLARLLRPGTDVVLASDFVGFNEAVGHKMRAFANRGQLTVAMIYDPLESEPPLAGSYLFVSPQGDSQRVHFSNPKTRRQWQQRWITRKEAIQTICRQLQSPFLLLDTLEDPKNRWPWQAL
ncbi:DUF58 domain-containing protein [Magnetococcales bacterium HHB-1]